MVKEIIPSASRRFSFFGPLIGDNRLATVSDINNVVTALNNQLFFRPVDFELTNNTTSDPTFRLLMSGASECLGSCNCSGDCGCAGTIASPACTKEAFPIITGVTRTSTGTYTVNFNPGHPDLTVRATGFWPEALPNKDYHIEASKIVNNVLTIKTYNGSNLSDTILNQTVFSLKLYVYSK